MLYVEARQTMAEKDLEVVSLVWRKLVCML